MWMFMLKSIKLEWANKILISSAKRTGAEILFIILCKVNWGATWTQKKVVAPGLENRD
jgi:hypothetical protein